MVTSDINAERFNTIVCHLLSEERSGGVQIRFGNGSELAVFQVAGGFRVGMSLCGADLRHQREILKLFEVSGCTLLEHSPQLRVRGKLLRAFLFQFRGKSKLLASLDSLRKWTGDSSRFLVRPAKVTLVWKKIRKRHAKHPMDETDFWE